MIKYTKKIPIAAYGSVKSKLRGDAFCPDKRHIKIIL
jgi:hypothetical protein